jgi:hypothetical protein
MRVVVLTCDRYLWAMRPFAYLFNTYWSSLQEVVVGCHTPPPFDLPDNYVIHSLGQDRGQDVWSDGLIGLLTAIPDDLIVLVLEDYWLCRTADTEGIRSLGDWMSAHSEVLRMDLTTDRLYNGQMVDSSTPWGHYDLIETPFESPYQMSFQAGIWRRDLLLSLLHPGKSPWEVEMYTQPPQEMRVLGTRQWPLRYLNALKGGNEEEVLNLEELEPHHREVIGQWIPQS